MMRVATAEATAVATATSSAGNPAWARICGLTKRMYDIVRKVTMPARISVDGVDPARRTPKSRSIMSAWDYLRSRWAEVEGAVTRRFCLR
jgi:hypothetical protein